MDPLAAAQNRLAEWRLAIAAQSPQDRALNHARDARALDFAKAEVERLESQRQAAPGTVGDLTIDEFADRMGPPLIDLIDRRVAAALAQREAPPPRRVARASVPRFF